LSRGPHNNDSGRGEETVKFVPLVWAMLWRSRARTWLTFLSIAVAFLLFGLLQSVSAAFQLGVRLANDDRLVVIYRQGLTKLLPIAYRSRIEAVDGVMAVSPIMFLPAYYQDPRNPIQVVALDPANWHVIDPRIVMPAEQQRAFEARRTGVVAGKDLAQQFGWKLGDRIPLTSPQQRKDGGSVWEAEIVGIYEVDRKQAGRPVPSLFLGMHFDWYNEATAYPDLVVWFNVRVKDPAQAPAIAKAIDAEFRNSAFETRTQSEADFQRGFIKQLGNVTKMMTAILAAVFFTLLLVSGNTMMQAFRERVPELAVLKTLGFGDGTVAALVAAESLLLCLIAAAVGLALTEAVMPLLQGIRFGGGGITSGLLLERGTLLLGAALALGVGAAAALIPAWRSARLTVVDGLRAA
jgi:putative ABC transport system permease protein